MKNWLSVIKQKIKHPMIVSILLSIAINLFVETMSRHSILQAVVYMFTNPLVFIYNTMLILITVSIALFFRKRTFVYYIITLCWMVIGITDYILLIFRTTPFTAVDIILIKSAIAIWDYYLKFYHLILIAAALILAIIGCVFVYKKTKKQERTIAWWKLIIFTVGTFVLSIGMNQLTLRTGLLSRNFGNLADAYHSYGLPYCFTCSIFNTGIDKPDMYSSDIVKSIVDGVEQGKVIYSTDISPTITPNPVITNTPVPTQTPIATPTPVITNPVALADEDEPNIIFLQLESFFDITRVNGIEFTQDPIPFFHSLQKDYSSGYLSVPSIGAGTANTEFEIITGMNLDFFGPGEYPYKTILQKTTCESISYNLKSYDYVTHAIHNNNGTFYDRHLVFSQLGFDTFTSMEYMQNLEYNPTNWAKDKVLVSEIQKILDSTKDHDFIYAISVQGHGSYPEEALLENPQIDLTLPENLPSSLYYPMLYYTNQINEMDEFIKQLTTQLSDSDEKTVLVLYGDHLPGFSLMSGDLSDGQLFNTEYVIWANFEFEKEDKNLESYQLSAEVLNRLDMHEGIITKLHQTQKDSDIYLEELEILEYDMLYGDMECFGGVNPYKATNLQMGTSPIVLDKYDFIKSSTDGEPGLLVLNGVHFTPYSKIYVNDEFYNTIFVNDTVIIATIEEIHSGDIINVVQSGKDMNELSRTLDYIVQ